MNKLLIGRKIAGPHGALYSIEAFLGKGAFGSVFRVRSVQENTVAAIKILSLDYFEDKAVRYALMNEARLAVKIRHKNVVRVLFYSVDKTIGPYIMMEYINGGSLQQYLRSRKGNMLSLGNSIDIMMQISLGLQAVSKLLIHRDVKPDNILRMGKTFKVSDFGLSKIAMAATRTNTFKGLGCSLYHAPEVFENRKNTTKIDIYSAGLVFFEILALRHAFSERVPYDAPPELWLNAHRFMLVPDVCGLRNDVPLEISQLLNRMTSKRPQDRPDWNKVIHILERTVSNKTSISKVDSLVVKANRRLQDAQREKLLVLALKKQNKADLKRYKIAFAALLSIFDEICKEFNTRLLSGKIMRKKQPASVKYTLPGGSTIEVKLFSRCPTDHTIQTGKFIGGASIILDSGVSANLVLLLEGGDDRYGKWIGCTSNFNPAIDPQIAVTTLVNLPTSYPFGFSYAMDFYRHIGFIDGPKNYFVHKYWNHVGEFFIEIIGCAYLKGSHL